MNHEWKQQETGDHVCVYCACLRASPTDDDAICPERERRSGINATSEVVSTLAALADKLDTARPPGDRGYNNATISAELYELRQAVITVCRAVTGSL